MQIFSVGVLEMVRGQVHEVEGKKPAKLFKHYFACQPVRASIGKGCWLGEAVKGFY